MKTLGEHHHVENSLAQSVQDAADVRLLQSDHKPVRRSISLRLAEGEATSLPATVAMRLAGRSDYLGRLEAGAKFVCPSLRHGRSLSVRLRDGAWLSVKGCGWTWGPPWVWLSPKDTELCFGLLDRRSAAREVGVSAWLRNHGVDCCRAELLIELDQDELALLGVNPGMRYLGGRSIQPSALFTVSDTPYRVADLWSHARDAAMSDMRRVFDSDSPAEIFDNARRRTWPT